MHTASFDCIAHIEGENKGTRSIVAYCSTTPLIEGDLGICHAVCLLFSTSWVGYERRGVKCACQQPRGNATNDTRLPRRHGLVIGGDGLHSICMCRRGSGGVLLSLVEPVPTFLLLVVVNLHMPCFLQRNAM